MPSGFNNRPNLSNRLGDNLTSQAAGIFSTRPSARYASGARAVLKINNKLCGFAFGISWRISTATTDITTIDDYFPHEIAPQRVTVEGSISALHIPGQSASTELWQPDALNFLFQQYISIEVRDSATDQLLFYTNKAMITSRQEDIRVDSLASVQLSWRAIGFQDERKPELAEGVVTNTQENKNPPSRRTTSEAFEQVNRIRGRPPFGSGSNTA
jgi:hypothetical protein